MSQRIALRVEAPAWRRQLPAAGALVRRAAHAALTAVHMDTRGTGRGKSKPDPAGELCLVLADDALQRRLNHVYRGRDGSTNVLSFEGAPASLGDVVLALETVTSEAESQGKSLADHVAHLVVHGVLHLMGYDHRTSAQARRMESLEIAILAGIGIADPYGRASARTGQRRRRRA